jgi:molybdate transport system ATP-binding protein
MPGDGRLRVRALVAGAPGRPPRLEVNLALGDGVSVVMGRSGAGKTTLLAAIAGLLRPDAGHIELDGRLLFDRETRTFVPPHRRRVALVFQSLALFPHLLVWENVAYGLSARTGESRKERALRWLERAHVEHVAERSPTTLSGGEAQRVALARALASEPRALLLDEPFSAMDERLRQQLGGELKALVAAAGIPAVLVTHDRGDAEELGSELIVLEAGRLRPPA